MSFFQWESDAEEFKRWHMRQNRELAHANAKYAQLVSKLELQVRQLQFDNLWLQAQVERLSQQAAAAHATEAHALQTRSIETQTYPACSPHQESLDSPTPMTSTPPSSEPDTDLRKDGFTDGRAHRSRERKCYTLPNIKSKLRKGDPHTFGNDTHAL